MKTKQASIKKQTVTLKDLKTTKNPKGGANAYAGPTTVNDGAAKKSTKINTTDIHITR